MKDDLCQTWLPLIQDREQLLGKITVRKMAQIFVDEIGDLIRQCEESLKDQNFTLAQRTAHQIAGHSGALDFIALCERAQTLEKCCRDEATKIDPSIISMLTQDARCAEKLLKGRYTLS